MAPRRRRRCRWRWWWSGSRGRGTTWKRRWGKSVPRSMEEEKRHEWLITGGGLDLFALPEVQAPAGFGARIQILAGVAPAFADRAVSARPSAPIMWFLNRRFGLGLPEYDSPEL